MPASVRNKVVFTGYLPRAVPRNATPALSVPDEPFFLVTPGGGGDGEVLVDWVLRAYEADPHLPYPALIVLGPFMQADRQAEFLERVARHHRLQAITFDAHMEALMAPAIGVVAMGGYNTFCEILSLDKRALLVPRTVPRREQFIRAQKAQALGLVYMLPDDGVRDPAVMATALRQLPQQPRPSEVVVPGLLDGLDNVNRLVGRLLDHGRRWGVARESKSA